MKYSEAICNAQYQILTKFPESFIMGQGVCNPWMVGATTKGLSDHFDSSRLWDVPISENAMTGIAIGAAMAGMKPIVFHPRMDFMYLAMDQIINHCAHWHYMFGGQQNVPVVIRGIINRGNEQAAQHSQSPYAMYAHVPGLKIVMPATPYSAKGLLCAAIEDPNPVLYIDDRWLYDEEQEVPADYYTVEIGKASILQEGTDITVVALSYLVREAMAAAKTLASEGISVQVVDLATVKPLDRETIIAAVATTGRLVIADPAWPMCSVASEISALVGRELFGKLRAPIEVVNLPDAPAPASIALEKTYYPTSTTICEKIRKLDKI